MLPGEARLRAVLVDRRRADGQRSAQRAHPRAHRFDRGTVVAGHGLDDRTRQRDTRRQRKAGPYGVPEPDRLRAALRLVVHVAEGDDAIHPNTTTSPAAPSTLTPVPSGMSPVASRVPTAPGIPYSRATSVACDSRPPLSVTIPPSSGSRMLNASLVDSVRGHRPARSGQTPLARTPGARGP